MEPREPCGHQRGSNTQAGLFGEAGWAQPGHRGCPVSRGQEGCVLAHLPSQADWPICELLAPGFRTRLTRTGLNRAPLRACTACTCPLGGVCMLL